MRKTVTAEVKQRWGIRKKESDRQMVLEGKSKNLEPSLVRPPSWTTAPVPPPVLLSLASLPFLLGRGYRSRKLLFKQFPELILKNSQG